MADREKEEEGEEEEAAQQKKKKRRRLGEIKQWRKERDSKIMGKGRDLGANRGGKRGRGEVEVGNVGGGGGVEDGGRLTPFSSQPVME